MRYLLCVLIFISTLGWAQSPDPASAANKITKPYTSCEGKVLILRSGAWTCETVTGGTGTGTTYSFQPPMSESNGTVTIDLTPYATTTNVTGLLATKSDTNHTHAAYAAKQDAIPTQAVTLQKFLTSWDATSKTFGTAQPSCGGLSDSGNGCLRSVGTTAGTLMDGADSRVTGALPANGITSTAGVLTLPGSTGGDILIPDGGTAAANHLTSAATAILTWGTLPVAIGQHARITTGSVAGSSSAQVTVTWALEFPSTTYDVSCVVIEATTSGSTIRFHHVESQTTKTAVVRVINDDTGAHTGTLSCLALN